ncbi:guanine deaminase [Ascobolus immersus RN42]|uniref:Guanine deaminase n=1 Tax=Ascobolus immersus RN42 TaxID=1160509 RepID=A0A3N4IBB2_ASCIM|nr:guanine deaminase [Ascobolus immersus RN42]
MSKLAVYFGTFIHSRSLTELKVLENAAVGVDKNGIIAFVEEKVDDLKAVLNKHKEFTSAPITRTKRGQFFFPGFIDTHIHASQYPNTGIFGKSTLLDWLNTYTFPTESSFKNLKTARAIYSQVIKRTLSHGTTTATYYATIHVPATNLLSTLCQTIGQRAFIGRVCMDCLGPEYYIDESAESSLAATEETIAHIEKIDPTNELLTPIITPRFAPSCSRPLLHSLAKLSADKNLPIQTHLSENTSELELVASLFPEEESYTHVYHSHKLLTPRTVLAHAIHLSDKEIDLIKQQQSKISHCPNSNTNLTSGFCKVRKLLDKKVDVGLGTDVSGGYSPSILDAVRQALGVSRSVAFLEKSPDHALSVEEGLYLATRGGAKCLGLEDKVGGFEVGKSWDVQLVGLNLVPELDEDGNLEDGGDPAEFAGTPECTVDVFGQTADWADRIAKWVYTGDDRCTRQVWVGGRSVVNKD